VSGVGRAQPMHQHAFQGLGEEEIKRIEGKMHFLKLIRTAFN